MTNLGAKPRCPDCGAQLRRGREADQRCDPCQRQGSRLALPENLYDQPRLTAALAEFDFGAVFRAARATQRWSQRTLAEFLDMEQGRISDVENGNRHLLDLRVVVRVTNRLAIPAGKLGFAHGTTVGHAEIDGRKLVSWVDRRDFVQHIAGLTLGAGVAGLDIHRLIALLPHTEPTGTRHIGAADVEAIEQATTTFVRQDFAHGSGLAHDVAVAHLHDAARRLWLIALDVARATDHSQGSDLTVYLLYDMAIQAVKLGRPDEALRLVHLGHATATGSHPVSAATTGCLASIQARAYATQSDATGCGRALGQAAEQLSTIDPATTPSWGAHVGEAGMSGFHGTTHYELALASRDSHAANRAVPLLRQAVDGFGPGYARLRGLYLPDLAGAHTIAGDTDTAVSLGHQAIDAVTTLHSPRAYDRLRVLNTALQPLHTSAGVAELRDRLSTTAA